MKTLFNLLVLAIGTTVFSQTYMLDDTFAIDGRQYFPGNSFNAKKGILLNNHYFLISSDKVIKIDYNGGMVNSFGVNGELSPLPTTNYAMMKITSSNNYIYISGYVIMSNSITDFFICKIDENGNPDNTFGNNGIATVDFGKNERINDFLIEPSGKLFCIGSRTDPSVSNSSRMIYFKINTDGTVDTAFDPIGFKSIQYNISTKGTYITSYSDGYLLVGTTRATPGDLDEYLLLVKVNASGSIMPDFGNGGIRSKSIQYLSELNWAENNNFYNDKLYLSDLYTIGFVGQTGSLLIYDVGTDQVDYHHRDYSTSYFNVYDDGIFLTGHYSNCGGNTVYACQSTFNLRKKYFNGATDPNFQNNSVFEYEFPNNIDTNNKSRFFIRDNDGKFLIVAYSNMYSNLSVETEGLSMIRIKEGTLNTSTPTFDKFSVSIYPNPFDDKINIYSEKLITEIELFDFSGRKLTTPKFEQQKNVAAFNLTQLKTSTYLLKIYFDDGSIILKKILRK